MIDYNMKPFRFWCQKVLPLVYDDSLSYMELLCKVVNYLNHVIEDVNNIPTYINELISEDILKDIMSNLLNKLREQIANANEEKKQTASVNRYKGELVWLNDKLCRITRNMLAGEQYIEETGEVGITGNFVYTTIETEINNLQEGLESIIGNITNLNTSDKTNIVNAINSLVTDLSTLSSEINGKIGDLANLNTDNKNTIVQAINEVLNRLINEAINRQEAIDNLRAELDPPRRMILIGDSWATGFKGGVGYLASPWPNQIKAFFGLSNNDCYIIRADGASFTNANSNMNFEAMLTAQYENIESATTITDIVVCAGNNEMTKSTTDIVNAIDSFAAYCRNHYPNATVSIGMIGGGKDTDVTCYDNVVRSSVYCFYEYSLKGYEKGANKNINCRYLNGVQYACRQNVYSYFGAGDDDQHPSQGGQDVISSAIATALRNGITDTLGFTNSMSLTSGTNVSVITSAPWYNRLIDNIVSIGSHDVTTITLQNVTNYVCDGTHEIELFNINGGSIVGAGEGTQKYLLPCYILDGDGAFHSANISIYFKKQKVYGNIICMGSGGWLTKTLASLWIPKFAFEIDSMTC